MVIQNFLLLLNEDRNNEDPKAVAYFYCDRSEPERRDPSEIMRAIIKQLSFNPRSNGFLAPIVDEYKKRQKTQASGSLMFKECHDILVQLLGFYSQTTIIIDALDESDPDKRTDLLHELQTLLSSSDNLVKIFVSSRDDGDIVYSLHGVPNLFIEAKNSNNDIARFVDRELENPKRQLLRGRASDDLKKLVRQTLVEKADGM